jgi:nitrite reductase/ring-hydroxylating ferredoxin subunit/uncharacterized membrane protein
MMKDVLQGKPLRHPLHPLLVHFPIGLFFFSFVLDVIGLIWPFPGLVAAAFYAIALGLVTGLLAAVPGLIDYAEIRQDHAARKTATSHMLLNVGAIILYAINLGMRYDGLEAAQIPWAPFILSALGIGILSVSGYLGGKLVYDDGIAVGRHRRQASMPDKTIEVPVPEEAGYVTVGSAGKLQHGETWRVEINGTIMAIVRLGDDYHAFQEFCPHRYGPLSEGSFQDGQVECPWHRSCFDVRTGKVVHGPAKADLKTFSVRIQNGQVQVRAPERPQAESGLDGVVE